MSVELMNGCAVQEPTQTLPSVNPEKPALTLKAAILFTLGCAPLLVLFFVNLWSRPHYQFFPLAIIGAGVLGWMRLQELPEPRRSGDRTGSLLLIALSFVLLLIATVFWSPWFGGLATLSGLVAGIWIIGGRPMFRALAPAIVLLLAIVPPPLALDTRFAEQLRSWAVNGSSHLLDLAGVTHSRSGNVIELPGEKLMVEEACSGINSVLVTMACCLFYMLWRKRSVIRTVICLAGCVSFVLLGNLIRISAGAWLKYAHNIQILSGWKHEVCGIILFASYVTLIFSLDKLLDFLTSPIRTRKRSAAATAPEPAPIPRAPYEPITRPWTTAAACLFAFLGFAGLGLGWSHHQQAKSEAAIPNSGLKPGTVFSMPEKLGDWIRLNGQSPPLQKVETLGVNSQVWHYQNKDMVASVAIDYPFRGYHDVTLCYTLRGWDAGSRQAHSSPGETASGIPFTHVEMQNQLGTYGSLWFSTIDDRGRWLETPALQRSLAYRWKLPGTHDPITYRFQVLSATYSPLAAAEREVLKNFFDQARLILWKQLAAQMQPAP